MMVQGIKCLPPMCEDQSAEPQIPHKPGVVEVVLNPSMHFYLEIGCEGGKLPEGLPDIQDSKPKRNQTKGSKQQLMSCDRYTHEHTHIQHTHATCTRLKTNYLQIIFRRGVVVPFYNPNISETRHRDQMFKTAWATMQDPTSLPEKMISKCFRETTDRIWSKQNGLITPDRVLGMSVIP